MIQFHLISQQINTIFVYDDHYGQVTRFCIRTSRTQCTHSGTRCLLIVMFCGMRVQCWDLTCLLYLLFPRPPSLPAAAPPPPPPPQRCATLPHSDIPIKTQTTSKSAGSTRLGLCQTYFIFNDGPSIQFICAFSSHPYLYFVYVHNT